MNGTVGGRRGVETSKMNLDAILRDSVAVMEFAQWELVINVLQPQQQELQYVPSTQSTQQSTITIAKMRPRISCERLGRVVVPDSAHQLNYPEARTAH